MAQIHPDSLVGLDAGEAEERVQSAGMRVKVVRGPFMSLERGINRVVLVVQDERVVRAFEA